MTPDSTDDTPTQLDPRAVSILQGIFGLAGNDAKVPVEEAVPKTASVKFMITLKDEMDLGGLGYSPAQIHRMKPEEAHDIIRSGTRAEPDLP